MAIDTLVPNRIRRRYSAKLTLTLAAVIAATAAVGVVLALHVQGTAANGQIGVDTATSAIAGLLIVVVFHLGIVGIVLGGNVALALSQLTRKAERVGAGDFDVDVESDRVDEIGRLYESFATMRDSLEVTLSDLETQRERATTAQRETERRNEALSAEAERFSAVMEACADGDLRGRLDPQTDDEAMNAIAEAFNEMLDDLGTTLGEVQRFAAAVDEASTEVETGAVEIRRASREVAGAMQEIADGASTQSEDLEVATAEIADLSATAEEMASTASTIADQSERVATLADDGRLEAADAHETMRAAEERTDDLAETIQELNENARQVGAVIELIDEIAQQTNMLALNASLESARSHEGASGAAGGFDAVAAEIKQLAQQVQDAIDEIEGTLQAIERGAATSAEGIEVLQGQLTDAAGRVETLHEDLESIAEDIDTVDTSIQVIDQATSDQSRSAQELATITEDVSSVAAETSAQAQDVAAASEEATATSETVTEEATDLDRRANRLAEATDAVVVPDELDVADEPAYGADPAPADDSDAESAGDGQPAPPDDGTVPGGEHR